MKRSVFRAKKRYRRSPVGRTVFKLKPKKSSAAVCGLCNARLMGVLGKGAKTRKRPERVFGGVLCASCTENILKTKARLRSGVLQEQNVPLKVLPYVRMLKKF